MLQRPGFVCGLIILFSAAAGYCAAEDAIYVGAEKCKNCHSAPSKGDPYGKWTAEKHSKAYQVLATDEAKKTAAAKNIADPQKSAECLKCHVTAFDAPAAQKHKKFDVTLGVQCETCHGPGSKHVEARLKAEEDDTNKLVTLPQGEIIGAPTSETCRKCHNKDSPNYQPFAFNKFYPVIAHLDPRKKRPADYLEKIPAEPTDDPKAVTPGKK
ncbi:MAG TPA: cytochrome c family protein [Planctomycetota bacterium]|nr:cytochrome c family protein [Planctomycetota bacterium]